MTDTITEHLKFLYGESTALEVTQAVRTTLRDFCTRVAADGGSVRATEKDSMLITYADQVRHPGERPLETLGRFLAGTGSGAVTAVHLLPFYPSSSDDGFSVKDYFAVDPAFGTWDDVAALGASHPLMFDAVFNHASAKGEWFQKFLRQEPGWETAFVTVDGDPDLSQVIRPRALPLLTEFETAAGPRKVWTTFSADQVDVNFGDPRMLLRILEVLLFYVKHGARFLRLDAIAFLWKIPGTTSLHLEQTHRVIRLFRSVLDEVAPGVQLITETNVPHRDNISYFGDGNNEAQMVYNFALPPLVFHTLRTGNARTLRGWAAGLECPSDRVTFFNFLASHDGIGMNPARGILEAAEIDALVQTALDHGGFVSYKNNPDGTKSPYELNISYFDALSDPQGGEPEDLQVARFLAAHAIMLALRGLPGIYFHSLFGSRGDRVGAEVSGIPRRINRKKLERSELEADLQRPDSLRSRVFAGLKALLQARASHPAFDPYAGQTVPDADDGVFIVERHARDGSRVLCGVNVTDAERRWDFDGATWRVLHSSRLECPASMPPYGILWLIKRRAPSK